MRLLPKLSLRQSLLLVGLLPAALLAAGIIVLFLLRGSQAMDAALHDRGIAIVSFLAPASEYGVISGNRGTQTSLLQAALEQSDVAAAAIYNFEGTLIAVSGRLQSMQTGLITASRVPSSIVHGGNRHGFAAPVISAPLVIDDVLEPQLRSAAGDTTDVIGWVYVELDTRPLAQRKREILVSTLLLFIVGLGLAGVLASRLAAAVGAPLARLVEAVRQISAGDLEASVPDDAKSDELRSLQRGFNTMARSIAHDHKDLQAKIDEATKQLAHQALHDPLTGLPNRRAFEQALDDAVSRSRRAGDRSTLCFIDLDRFKIVNDTCGHAAGDELLKIIADLIAQRVRTGDLISRIGGDEFALILHDCSPEDARRLAEDLREAVSTLRFQWEGRRFSVGASVGLVRVDGRVSSASELLVAADLACYAAKKGGRNRVMEHDAEPVGGRRKTDIALASSPFMGSVDFSRLSLYQQPIVKLDGAPSSDWVEVLLRIKDADGVPQSPNELLSNIELATMRIELDLWVTEQACVIFSRRAGAAQPRQRFSLNVSAASVLQPERYWPKLQSVLNATALPAELLVLEFPAKLVEQSPEESARFAAEARRLGIRIALEKLDGTSTGLLHSLQPDFVKVSFKTLVESYGLEAGCNLAQALCGMAAALSIPTVASEVEDELILTALRDYGFNYGQGRLLIPAEPLTD